MSARRGPRPLSTGVQFGHLCAIGFRGALRRDELDVRAEVYLPLSDTYILRIRYRLGSSPKVTVEEPKLCPLDDGTPVPHLYEGDLLCLYQPHMREWGPEDRISVTIVPWALEWLKYYEVWRSTCIWVGGGDHPPRRNGRRRHKRIR